MKPSKIYQVSTLQALSLGYSRSVITVGNLLEHGDTGLGTFEDVSGEMIVIDGHCYRAMEDGSAVESEPSRGVPFAAVSYLHCDREVPFGEIPSIDVLKQELTRYIEEGFGLNSMHIVRIDGSFAQIDARSGPGQKSQHVPLKEMLAALQQNFVFRDVAGSLICVYFPDYMDGINAAGWHLHFISEDRTCGGHVFDLSMKNGTAVFSKMTSIEIQLPTEPAFDTYALKEASQDEIKEVEQGKK